MVYNTEYKVHNVQYTYGAASGPASNVCLRTPFRTTPFAFARIPLLHLLKSSVRSPPRRLVCILCIQYTGYNIIHTVYWILSTIYCKHNVYCMTAYWTLPTVQYTIYFVLCIVYCIKLYEYWLYTVSCTLYTVYCVLYTVWCVLCAVVLYTVWALHCIMYTAV